MYPQRSPRLFIVLFQEPATTDIYTLSLHDALPICTASVLYIGVHDIKAGKLTLGSLLLVMGYLGQLYGPLRTVRSEEHTSELQSRGHLVCRLLLEKKKSIPTHYETACEIHFTVQTY